MQHEQVVAKVEVGFPRIGRVERGSALMIDCALRYNYHPVTGQMYAPAKVYLFHVGEKKRVEPSNFSIDFGADEESGAAGPKYIARFVVVLSPVGLYRAEYSSPAKGIAIAVDKSAGSAGVFKFFPFTQGFYFRLAGRYIVVCLGEVE